MFRAIAVVLGFAFTMFSMPTANAGVFEVLPSEGGVGTLLDGQGVVPDGEADDIFSRRFLRVRKISSSGGEMRGVIEFSLEALTDPVDSAVFTAIRASGRNKHTLDVYGYGADGVLSLDDFNAGSFLQREEFPPTRYELDITELVNGLIGQASHVGLVLRVPDPSSSVVFPIGGKNILMRFSADYLRDRIVLPEPETYTLMLLGLASLFRMRSR